MQERVLRVHACSPVLKREIGRLTLDFGQRERGRSGERERKKNNPPTITNEFTTDKIVASYHTLYTHFLVVVGTTCFQTR